MAAILSRPQCVKLTIGYTDQRTEICYHSYGVAVIHHEKVATRIDNLLSIKLHALILVAEAIYAVTGNGESVCPRGMMSTPYRYTVMFRKQYKILKIQIVLFI